MCRIYAVNLHNECEYHPGVIGVQCLKISRKIGKLGKQWHTMQLCPE